MPKNSGDRPATFWAQEKPESLSLSRCHSVPRWRLKEGFHPQASGTNAFQGFLPSILGDSLMFTVVTGMVSGYGE